jgi:hypothetical protein
VSVGRDKATDYGETSGEHRCTAFEIMPAGVGEPMAESGAHSLPAVPVI